MRGAFLLLFSLTLASFVMGIIGGEDALWTVTIAAGLLALAAGTAYSFREFLIIISGPQTARALRTAPLTAAFGMFVIFTYAVLGIFAPVIAPFGEAEVISQSFAPADENMLLGADQLGPRHVQPARVRSAEHRRTGAARDGDRVPHRCDPRHGGRGQTGLVRPDHGPPDRRSHVDPVAHLRAAAAQHLSGPTSIILVIIIGVIYSPRVYRLTRAVAGNVVVMDYIEAAKLRGRRHVVPDPQGDPAELDRTADRRVRA